MIKKYKRALRLFLEQAYPYYYFKRVVNTKYESCFYSYKIKKQWHWYMIHYLRSLRKKYKKMYKNNIGKSK